MKKLLLGLLLSISVFATASFAKPVLIGDAGGILVTGAYAQDCTANPNAAGCQNSIPILSGIQNAIGSVLGFFGGGLAELIGRIILFGLQTINKAIVGLGGMVFSDAGSPPPEQVFEQTGALGMIGFAVQGMYENTPPISASEYLANIHPITQVSAQGVGERTLNPIFEFWALMRNVAYGLFIIVLAAIGLMIMFRSKIDPRTVVTVQAALPNLVVSLVLITFSFALAGFLIDMGRLIQEVIINLLDSNGILTRSEQASLTLTSMWKAFAFNGNNPVSFGGGNVFVEIAAALVNLVILVFALIVSFQIFFLLLFKYVALLIKPIFAPLAFLFGALPGRGGATGSWFKDYFADVLAFPAILFMLNLAVAIKTFAPALVQNDPFNLFGGAVNLTSIVALGVLIFATKVPAAIEEALEVKHSPYVGSSGARPEALAKRIPIIGNFM